MLTARVAVRTDVDVGPRECRGREVTRAVAVEPLLLVEHEAERADEVEVVGGQRVERLGVGRQLGVDPAGIRGRRIWSVVMVCSSLWS